MTLRSKLLLIATTTVSLAALGACNNERGQASLAPITSDSSHALVFSDDGANAKLALAENPATLMLECAHGSRTVHVTHASAEAPAPVMVLASGAGTSEMRADRQAFEGQTLVLGDTTTDAPALTEFRRSGRLQVRYSGVGLTADAHPEPFFAACEGRVG